MVAVDTTTMPNEYYVFSAMAVINRSSWPANNTQTIQARLIEDNTVLATLDFDSTIRDKQVQATTVCLNRGAHSFAVKLLISGTTASCY